ncbi:methyltransferase-like protein 25 [Manduca sexta]|uniref:methyltransferase-like protein 25 n=1 Tax=Manduca sexta TaxID=7130 RepID=UPI0018900099|nr:methyltransferase-like protein 25 [Manduca sexta]
MMQESHSENFSGNHTPMTSIRKLHHQLDNIIRYLTPLLPIANCHMVEFLTENHWNKLLPGALRDSLDKVELEVSLQNFWQAAEGHEQTDVPELKKWVTNARSYCVTANNDYCLSKQQFHDKIKSWGAELKEEIRVKEFMTSKKSYEVQTMSQLVASLHHATAATCCVEAGGGRGHLPAALSLGYNIPSLTIDCDDKTLAAAVERVKIIQKKWHAIAKRINKGKEERVTGNASNNIHRFAKVFITNNTDLCGIVKEKFPEFENQDVKLLLTGLHTCGNLGPDSLRLFATNDHIATVFNVPCCYHLLTETVDENLFDVFQRNYGGGVSDGVQGFPMSEYLTGFSLGRNGRMLAAQSIDRVVNERQLPSKSLLYRALLQDIIKKYLPDVKITEGKLKRISSKCLNFEQYVNAADAILKLDILDRLSERQLSIEDEDSQWKKLVLFYLIRLCLAQVVESVILLDRVLYLYENGSEKVHLVKLFDPVVSPRCHSIVAIR